MYSAYNLNKQDDNMQPWRTWEPHEQYGQSVCDLFLFLSLLIGIFKTILKHPVDISQWPG